MEPIRPSLLVLAAGMGSRYGSLKQMDGVGPGGEAILDYSVYDALRAGFGQVVFVIRHDFEQDFRALFGPERFGGRIAVDYVFQEIDHLPTGFSAPEGRTKPWGTNHAVMMARGAIRGPFAVVNADDFYGADAYRAVAGYLDGAGASSNRYCMVGYRIGHTLSEHGTVSRGVCTVDEEGNLRGMVERTSIGRRGEGIFCADESGGALPLAEDTVVSMNLFGFTPDYFDHSEALFREFLRERGTDPRAEFYIPSVVNQLISGGQARVRVLRTEAEWFGVTYKEDRERVVGRLRRLVDEGVYPEKLWR